jgi:hypothetical protein
MLQKQRDAVAVDAALAAVLAGGAMNCQQLQLPSAGEPALEMRAEFRVPLVFELAHRTAGCCGESDVLGDVGAECLLLQRRAQPQPSTPHSAFVGGCSFTHTLALVLRVDRIPQQ